MASVWPPKLSPAVKWFDRFCAGIALIIGSAHRPLSLVVLVAATYFTERRTLFLLSDSSH
jgi:hypothetical protein